MFRSFLIQSVKRIIPVLIVFQSVLMCGVAFAKPDSLLSELDNVINTEKQFTDKKKAFLNKITQRLSRTDLAKTGKYEVYSTLAKEYEGFISDSAKLYGRKALQAAQQLGDSEKIRDSKIQLARIMARVAMFSDAVGLLDEINKGQLSSPQRIAYYKAYIETYIYWIEFQGGNDIDLLVKKRNDYQDSLLSYLPADGYEYAINFGTKCIESGHFQQAENILLACIPSVKQDTREYSVLASILAYLYEKKGEIQKQQKYLAMSAISDIRAAIKENLALRELATLLYGKGDTERANSYIKKSLEDANFYNARLRNIQTSRVLPIIDKAYQLDREKYQQKLRVLLVIVSVLSLVLLIGIVFIFRQMRALAKAQKEILQINSKLNELNEELKAANEQQKQTNIHLAEANHIKEKFISQFLEICTEHIEKLDAFKLMVHRKIKAGQINDLLKITSTSEDSMKEQKSLYASFDKAFLNIYPDFVKELNRMLRLEEQYPLNDGKSLNQELRVFALIRLGITDSNKIATFLHYSLRTIYNYRSKVKSKSLNQEVDFEEKVRQIGLLE
ncbi:DUF6377 domain-containing protein [Arcticibacter tournemirensis]